MPTGNTVELSIPPPYTVEITKQVIPRDEGIHPLCQQLTFNERVLEDGHTLDEYNVQYGSTLDLVIRQGGKYICCVSLYNLPTHNLPVIIRTPKGDIFLETQPSYTIGLVKYMIQEKKGIPTDELKLIFADQSLEDGCTLSVYNIQDGALLYIGRMDVHVPLMLYHLSPLHISWLCTFVNVIINMQ